MGFALFFLALMAMHIYLVNSFFTQLKQSHEKIWQELGQPQWKIHFGDDSFKNAMKYIRKKEFTDLKDDVLEELYGKIKRIENTSIALAVGIVSATIISVIKGQ